MYKQYCIYQKWKTFISPNRGKVTHESIITTTAMTFNEQIDRRLWNPMAIREATINSIVHKLGYKIESIFANRICSRL